MQKTVRRSELSLMNVVLCLAVIFIHVSGWGINNADRASWQYAVLMIPWRLCSLAVPGFIFLSAVKLALGCRKKDFSYPKYLFARIKRVWIPYAVAVLVYFLIFILIKWIEPSVPTFVKLLFDGNMSYHFYFVVIIMQFYLLAPLWRWIAVKLADPVFAVISVAAALPISQLFGQYLIDVIHIFYKGALFPYSDRIFTTYLFWWMLGLALGANYERVKAAISKNTVAVSIFFAFSAIHNLFLTYLNTTGKESVYWLETANILYIFSGIIFLFAICCKPAGTRISENIIVSELDGAAYLIYLWHPMFLNAADLLLSYSAFGIFARLTVRASFGFILSTAVCVVLRVAARKIRQANREKNMRGV